MAQHDPILAALDAQVACYRRLAKLAEQQHELVQQGMTEELLQLLTMRQVELDQLAAHERTLRPAKSDWQVYLARLAAVDKARAESLMTETRLLLERITSADKNDVLVLQQRKLSLGRQIGQASAGRVVNRAYAANAYGSKTAKLNVQT
ncbi:hypothetical protein [Humisphaera borealis]|uniref:Flagellar protein FlgN n=1 Tax=Humisphaera borealis TaxID=2807512 RepID=A0A7M2WZI5_9BACT|nr:hypothetical protein [Humisphaera borealis]QOV89900.1 hypothetical protein IPV69_00560 [Humisphaera borealis]